jgi:8-oxo-dGTP pyrophosphatase MutT (NUDIX family)
MTPPITLTTVDTLDLAFADQPWAFARERAAEIEGNWQRLIASNPALFNGPVLLLRERGITTEPDGQRVFRATFFETDYKSFLGFRDLGFPDPSVRNGFAMAALRTSDGAYLLGEMGAQTAIAGQVQFPAGTPDPSDRRGDTVDLDAGALRELHEETGIRADQVTVVPGWTLVTVGARIAFMKEMQIDVSAPSVLLHVSRFLATEAVPEFCRVFTVRRVEDLVGMNMPGFVLAYLQAKWSTA